MGMNERDEEREREREENWRQAGFLMMMFAVTEKEKLMPRHNSTDVASTGISYMYIFLAADGTSLDCGLRHTIS